MKNNNRSRIENSSQPTWHRFVGSCLPLLLAMMTAGCQHGQKAAAEPNPVGNYTLVSVDGNKVPCTLQHEGAAITVKSGAFTINADGTCSSLMQFSVASHGDASREVKASYTRDGSKLTMQWEGAGTTIGTVAGDTFTMNNEGMILAYRR